MNFDIIRLKKVEKSMIHRKISEKLEDFYKANGRYALLVDGARQVGKTYSIELVTADVGAGHVRFD